MNSRSNSLREKLEKKLINSRSELLWSHDKEELHSLSDEVIIEKFLSFGSKNDWQLLKEAFPLVQIKQVWKDNMLLAGFQPEKQKKIVRFFFNSKNPSSFIYQNKRRYLDKIITRSI